MRVGTRAHGSGYEIDDLASSISSHVRLSDIAQSICFERSFEQDISGLLQQGAERAYAGHHLRQQDQCNGQALVEPDQTNDRQSASTSPPWLDEVICTQDGHGAIGG